VETLLQTSIFTGTPLPRGLAAAVLASLPLISGVPNSQDFPQIAFIVIITSIIICTVGVGILKKRTQKT
jgi:cell volume regulation protein A